jgi:hypothetical protein
VKDYFKNIKSRAENVLAAESADEQLLMYVSVETELSWRGSVKDLEGKICTDMEVEVLNNQTLSVFDRRNPLGRLVRWRAPRHRAKHGEEPFSQMSVSLGGP